MGDFISVAKSRRSVNKFLTGIEIPNQDLDDIFQIVKFAPSAFNLQHTHYLVLKDQNKIEQVYEASGQYKVKTASAVIVVLGDLEAYRQVGHIHEGLLNLGVMSQQEFDMTVEMVTQMYEDRGDVFKRDEAIRNASLSAMQFMLTAKEKGWDTCPMIGYDAEKLQQLLSIPGRYVPVMLIAIGKEDSSSQRPRGYRKPVGEFVSFNTMP
ncbi:nitroreductase family protein [Paenibacillus sp. y28]|uniref:nitroreductase family protein n=1 Tax=Paenibacillus sp. y28 TaxID=3129110 RepID=UPI0030160852